MSVKNPDADVECFETHFALDLIIQMQLFLETR